jgi:hypothetical protein
MTFTERSYVNVITLRFISSEILLQTACHTIELMKTKDPRGRRYHPLFIQWCLNIMMVSPSAYNILRESDVLILPSKRTLLDHTHFFARRSGFQSEAFQYLYEDIKV